MEAVYPLAFPYSIGKPEKATLSKVVLRDDPDTSRINLTLRSGRCQSITFSDTETKETTETPIRYISNPLGSLPLLVCVPTTHHRLKLHIDVSKLHTAKNSENELIIVKSPNLKDDTSKLALLLINEDWTASLHEVSKISYSDLIPGDDLNIVIVNDSIENSFDTNTVAITVWEKSTTDHDLLFRFELWLESPDILSSTLSLPQPTQEPVQPPVVGAKDFGIKELRTAFNFDVQDGPEFRKVLNKYEFDTPKLKRSLIILQDEVKSFERILGQLMVRRNKIIDCVGMILQSQFNPLLLKLNVHKAFASNFANIFNVFQSNCSFVLQEILNQLLIAKITSYCSIPMGEAGFESSSKKKLFEKQSKEYYDWLNKYLSNEKDRPQLKLLLKRKNFELLKFDYLNSLNLVSNNQYFNKFLENLIKFSNLSLNDGYLDYQTFMDNTESQQLIDGNARLYLDTLSRFNSEKLQLRQMIEACQTNEELTTLLKENPISFSDKSKGHDSDLPRIETTQNIDPSHIFPASPIAVAPKSSGSVVSHDADHNPNMSGILYALGGQGKPGWHKEWVVLRNGQLIEFSDWRNGTSPINKPIDLAIASVKPINHDKRQYCFEIISSSGHKHVFQALNNEERNHWMKSLYNAGQITNRLITKAKKQLINTSFAKPSSSHTHEGNSSPVSIFSSSFATEDDDLIATVRALKDSGNDQCADCGSYDSVEWISLNNLVVICVNCSSCHRNMGSHISKVKSLKLDNFKREQRVLLNYIDNNAVNEYMEETVSMKIGPDASDEERLRYIKHKYEQKTFLSPIEDLSGSLVRLVRRIDVPGVVRSLNCGADPNLNVQISNSSWPEPKTISLFEYSLKKMVEIETKGVKKEYFVVSELLILNNCKVVNSKDLVVDGGLSERALQFWKEKVALYSTE